VYTAAGFPLLLKLYDTDFERFDSELDQNCIVVLTLQSFFYSVK